MQRILVMSDSHGRVTPLREIMKVQEEAKTIFFLGDGEQDILQIIREYPDRNFYRVKGNCDFGSTTPLQFITTLEYSNLTITAVHGHTHNVKYGINELVRLAEETSADIVLYGHTHVPRIKYDKGVYYICPGSVSSPRDGSTPTYVFIDIPENGKPFPSITNVPT